MEATVVCSTNHEPHDIFKGKKKIQWGKVNIEKEEIPCLHDSCSECHGSGAKDRDGSACFHMISCPCPRCSPFSL